MMKKKKKDPERSSAKVRKNSYSINNDYQAKANKNHSGSAEDLLDGQERHQVTTKFEDSFASDDSFDDDLGPPPPYTSYGQTKPVTPSPRLAIPRRPARVAPVPVQVPSHAPPKLTKPHPAPSALKQNGGDLASKSAFKPTPPSGPIKSTPTKPPKPAPTPLTSKPVTTPPVKPTPTPPTKPVTTPPVKPKPVVIPPVKPMPPTKPVATPVKQLNGVGKPVKPTPPAPQGKPQPVKPTPLAVPSAKPTPPSKPAPNNLPSKPNKPNVPPSKPTPASRPQVQSRAPPAPQPKPKPQQAQGGVGEEPRKPMVPTKKPIRKF